MHTKHIIIYPVKRLFSQHNYNYCTNHPYNQYDITANKNLKFKFVRDFVIKQAGIVIQVC